MRVLSKSAICIYACAQGHNLTVRYIQGVKLDLQEKMFRSEVFSMLKVRFGADRHDDGNHNSGGVGDGDADDLLALMTDDNQYEDIEDVTIFGCLPPPIDDGSDTKNLRGLVRDVLENAWYQRLILFAILVSCVVLVLDSPIPEYSRIDKELANTLNLWTFIIFILEFVLRLLDKGIYWEHPKAYFRVGWNILDFIVVIAQALDMLNLVNGLNTIKVIRVLRPLRLLNRIKLLMTLINVLQNSLVDGIILAIIFFFLIVVCAIFAQTLFAGYTYRCSDGGTGLRVSHLATPCSHALDPVRCDAMGRRRAPAIEWREDCRGLFFSEYAHTSKSTVYDPGPNWYTFKGDRNEIMRPRVWSVEESHNFDDFGSTLHTFMQVRPVQI